MATSTQMKPPPTAEPEETALPTAATGLLDGALPECAGLDGLLPPPPLPLGAAAPCFERLWWRCVVVVGVLLEGFGVAAVCVEAVPLEFASSRIAAPAPPWRLSACVVLLDTCFAVLW